jgi:hypothetical protein
VALMTDTVLCTGADCGRPIRWALTLGDRRMPLDPEPSPDGNVVLETQPDGSIRARVLTGDDLPAQDAAYVPHHRTCVNAPDYRRRKAARIARCRICRGRLHDLLVRDGITVHPGCEAPETIRQYVAAARPAAQQDELEGW